MSLKYALGYAFYVGTLILAKPLNISLAYKTPAILRLPLPSDLLALNVDTNSASNDSTTSLNVTSGQPLRIQCDGASYGFDLDIFDCEQAKAYVPPNADQVQWADRHTGSQEQIFPLPYRAMGDKALCYVQPVLIGGATSAKATTNQVRNAAAAVRHECFSGGKLQGGIATNIGGDNNLAVIMSAYQPPSAIQCSGKFRAMSSCQDVLEGMPVTTEKEAFGPSTDPTTQVLLPQAVESGEMINGPPYDTFCLLRIVDNSTTSDTAAWYEFWEATTAIWSACVRHGQGGSLGGLGEFLTVTSGGICG
ncbi:hypothetical protein HO133_003178 [Letharia lupina]|uniref:Uncharacterized protein n=1 Tax=Letharia lupina TaxID=560253 RepID=A0A8H6FA24_9LECA|nr:uncharacterized protein HO133_003178 [Letharia lupina]KAF6220745.1 hypothetical protein HO133_003178 [Letharia lupina]